MLGFRGHFSTTLGDIRAARTEHMRGEAITTGRLPLFDEDTVLVVSHWEYAGQGFSAGDALLVSALTGNHFADSGGVHE
nr:replication initiator [Streptosporangium amethystogenes]